MVSIPHWFDSSWLILFIAHLHQECFNSTLVRFKLGVCCLRRGPMISFNSTLVRFKHYAKLSMTGDMVKVSIPHWFDSSRVRPFEGVYFDSVSIPHWFDSSFTIRSN